MSAFVCLRAIPIAATSEQERRAAKKMPRRGQPLTEGEALSSGPGGEDGSEPKLGGGDASTQPDLVGRVQLAKYLVESCNCTFSQEPLRILLS